MCGMNLRSGMQAGRVCPSCGSANVAKYLYGFVAMDDELEQQLEEGKITLGGCEITEDAPEYYCNVCGNEW